MQQYHGEKNQLANSECWSLTLALAELKNTFVHRTIASFCHRTKALFHSQYEQEKHLLYNNAYMQFGVCKIRTEKSLSAKVNFGGSEIWVRLLKWGPKLVCVFCLFQHKIDSWCICLCTAAHWEMKQRKFSSKTLTLENTHFDLFSIIFGSTALCQMRSVNFVSDHSHWNHVDRGHLAAPLNTQMGA